MPQSNNIASGVEGTFGIPTWITGGVLTLLLGAVIIGGISRIVKVAEKIVPTMAVIYLGGALMVIIANFENVGPSFMAVFMDAFTGSAAAGGFLGATFAFMLLTEVSIAVCFLTKRVRVVRQLPTLRHELTNQCLRVWFPFLSPLSIRSSSVR